MSAANGPITCVLMLAGAGLYFAPETVAIRIRAVVADIIKPGQVAASQVMNLAKAETAHMATRTERSRLREIEQLQTQLQEEQARTASLQIRLARLADLEAREAALPDAVRSLPRLTSSSLIEATVLGDVVAEKWRKGKLLNQGESSGVRESELVVKSRKSLIDAGRDGSISPEDDLLLGRSVIGKIERVGRWTSTFLLVSDAGYRGRAQLIHQTDSGFVFGAKGILEGQGESICRLKGIASSDSVSVGDSVYTPTRDGFPSTPLYYGRVVEATLGPNDSEWNVRVEPVPVPNDLKDVQVLRTSINSDRLSPGSNSPEPTAKKRDSRDISLSNYESTRR